MRADFCKSAVMLRLFLLALAVCVSPLHADEPMSGEEFDAYTSGRVLFYGQDGRSYGAERYLPGRRVEWSFLDGECKQGRWYEEGRNICFVYEDEPEAHCWRFFRGPEGLVASFQDGSGASPLYEARDLGDELLCKGPRIGV